MQCIKKVTISEEKYFTLRKKSKKNKKQMSDTIKMNIAYDI